MNPSYNALMILGPTAAGKTRLAALIADKYNGEIISADSRQVYRGMDIGSGKDTKDYRVGTHTIESHCIDIAAPTEEVNVYTWLQEVYRVFPGIIQRGHIPVFCGGTGMYLDAVVRRYALVDVPCNQELRSQLAGKTLEELQTFLRTLKTEHIQDDLYERHRLLRAIEIAVYNTANRVISHTCTINPYIIGIRYNREDLRGRIKQRLAERLERGMIEEVNTLLKNGVPRERLERFGLEYRFVSRYIHKDIPTAKELFDTLYIAIRQFAKRQDTWFRGMERKGVAINWIDCTNDTAPAMFDNACSLISRII